jgi:hypothetical protein
MHNRVKRVRMTLAELSVASVAFIAAMVIVVLASRP